MQEGRGDGQRAGAVGVGERPRWDLWGHTELPGGGASPTDACGTPAAPAAEPGAEPGSMLGAEPGSMLGAEPGPCSVQSRGPCSVQSRDGS